MLLLSWLVVGGVTLACASSYFIPRYAMLAMPYLMIVVALLLYAGRRRRLPGHVILGGLIALNVANGQGRFFPPFSSPPLAVYARNSAFLERSREYLADHESNQRAVSRLVAAAPHTTIVTDYPFGHLLGVPRLGYVETPLAGYCDELDTAFIPTFRELSRWFDERSGEPIVVLASEPAWNVPAAGAQVLYRDELEPPLVAVRLEPDEAARFAVQLREVILAIRASHVEELARDGRWEYAEQRFAELERIDADLGAVVIARLPAVGGRTREAVEQLEALIAARPELFAARAALGDLYYADDDWSAAAVQFEAAHQLQPASATVRLKLAAVWLRLAEWDRAEQLLGTWIEEGDAPAPTLFLYGQVALRQGAMHDAAARFAAALAAGELGGQEESLARYWVAREQLRQGEILAARSELERVVQLAPESADAWYWLGVARHRQGEIDAALAALEAALVRDPEHAMARDLKASLTP